MSSGRPRADAFHVPERHCYRQLSFHRCKEMLATNAEKRAAQLTAVKSSIQGSHTGSLWSGTHSRCCGWQRCTCVLGKWKEGDRGRERQTDRQKGRDRDIHTETDKETGRHTQRQKDIQRDTHTQRQTYKETEIHAQRETERDKGRKRESPLSHIPFVTVSQKNSGAHLRDNLLTPQQSLLPALMTLLSCLFLNRVSFGSSGWPGTHGKPPVSTSTC